MRLLQNTRNIYIPSIRLAFIQRSTTSSHIKIFNKLPPRISGLKNDTILKSALRKELDKFLNTCIFFNCSWIDAWWP